MKRSRFSFTGHPTLADVTPAELVMVAKAREFCRVVKLMVKPYLDKIRQHVDSYFLSGHTDMILVDVYVDVEGNLRFSTRDLTDIPESNRIATLRAVRAKYRARMTPERQQTRLYTEYYPGVSRTDPAKLKKITFKR